jgi:uncharacterized protein (TIGR03435 family)
VGCYDRHVRGWNIAAFIAGVTAFGVGAAAQAVHYPTPSQPPGQPRLEFEVVSIMPMAPDARGGQGVRPMPADQGYICDGATLVIDMMAAYGVTRRQIEGGPSWIRSDRWNIEAKADHPYDVDDLHIMLEHALEDRFGLKLHRETRQENVLSLEVDRGGVKLKEHEPPNDPDTPPMGIRLEGGGAAELDGTNISMSYLAFFLSRIQPEPVLDRTGLTGHYDVSVAFTLPPPPPRGEDAAPPPPNLGPLYEVLRHTLGLRVVRGGKGPVDYLVIDSVHKPTAN